MFKLICHMIRLIIKFMQILSNQLPSLTLHLKYQGAIKKQQEEKKNHYSHGWLRLNKRILHLASISRCSLNY